MIILAGSIRITPGQPGQPGQREAAIEPMRRMVAATRAEPGCISYAFAFDVDDDHLIRIFEVFRDAEALAAHRASAHMAHWRASLPALGIGGREMWQYEVSEAKAI
jgi:quinol monooxygenase YgiN